MFDESISFIDMSFVMTNLKYQFLKENYTRDCEDFLLDSIDSLGPNFITKNKE